MTRSRRFGTERTRSGANSSARNPSPAKAAMRPWPILSGSGAARLLLAFAALLFAWPSEAAAQDVVLMGRGEADLDRRLDQLIGTGNYLLISRDTLIAQGDSVPGTLLVVGATLTLEGAVAGDVIGVDANMFIRPPARVYGDVVNVAGGLYPSALARIEGERVDEPLAPYTVIREPGGTLRIEGTLERPTFEFDGLFGFHAPTYDRVDALSLEWGGELLLPPMGRTEPGLEGWVGYASGRGALNGGLALVARRGRTHFAFGGEKRTVTNERWIRGDLRNSLSFLVRGKDYRDYWEAQRAYAEISRDFGREGLGATAVLRAQLEDAESLGAGDPWTLFGDDPRPNLPINEGRISSLVLELAGDWIGRNAAAEAGVDFEFAESVLGGDFSFGRFVAWGEWAMDALADHLLEVEWRFQGPLPGTESLPLQRWSFVGGSGTLNTFDVAEFRGDRLVFVESMYRIPLPERMSLWILGPPELQLIHAIGMAWSEFTDRDLEQNIGVRLKFFSPYVRIMTNPADPLDDIDVDIGLTWPFGDDRPWRRP